MARILMVGGGARGRALARQLVAEGHAVRATTRSEAGRAAIEAAGAECWIGTPDRLATLRYALDSATIACWLLGNACDEAAALDALHGTRLEFFATQTIDTTVRGVLFEAAGSVAATTLAAGARRVRAIADRNAIPLRVLDTDPRDQRAWVAAARAAIDSLLLA